MGKNLQQCEGTVPFLQNLPVSLFVRLNLRPLIYKATMLLKALYVRLQYLHRGKDQLFNMLFESLVYHLVVLGIELMATC